MAAAQTREDEPYMLCKGAGKERKDECGMLWAVNKRVDIPSKGAKC